MYIVTNKKQIKCIIQQLSIDSKKAIDTLKYSVPFVIISPKYLSTPACSLHFYSCHFSFRNYSHVYPCTILQLNIRNTSRLHTNAFVTSINRS